MIGQSTRPRFRSGTLVLALLTFFVLGWLFVRRYQATTGSADAERKLVAERILSLVSHVGIASEIGGKTADLSFIEVTHIVSTGDRIKHGYIKFLPKSLITAAGTIPISPELIQAQRDNGDLGMISREENESFWFYKMGSQDELPPGNHSFLSNIAVKGVPVASDTGERFVTAVILSPINMYVDSIDAQIHLPQYAVTERIHFEAWVGTDDQHEASRVDGTLIQEQAPSGGQHSVIQIKIDRRLPVGSTLWAKVSW